MTETLKQTGERLHQEAIAWHIRLTSGEDEAGSPEEFELWRRQSPRHAEAYREIETLWRQLPSPLSADRQRRRELAASKQRDAGRRRKLSLALAASLLLAVLSGIYPDYVRSPWADYRTHIGEQTSVTLADGSIAILNTDTALNVRIVGNERRVELLRGEAEFDVAHDSRRPFRVAAGSTTTEALGTRFIVRYDGRGGAVTLLEGKVRASRPSARGAETDTAVLQAGQQIAFNAEQLGAVHSVDPGSADAWRRGRLLMNFVPLKQVIAEINRYRRNPIALLDEGLAEREVNIAIDIKQIDAWLEALQHSMPVKIVRAGPLLFLRS